DFGISVLDSMKENPEFLQTMYQGKDVYGIGSDSLTSELKYKTNHQEKNLDIYKRLLDIKYVIFENSSSPIESFHRQILWHCIMEDALEWETDRARDCCGISRGVSSNHSQIYPATHQGAQLHLSLRVRITVPQICYSANPLVTFRLIGVCLELIS